MAEPMHVLIAPNAFKNSLPAAAVAGAIQQGLAGSRLVCTSECFPIGDGGDGTGDLIVERLGGSRSAAEARDPLGRRITTYFGLIDDGDTAVIEMANASGLRLLENKEPDTLHASSGGTGDLIKSALDRKVRRIILGMGGSATVDGGTGILQALGIRFLDKEDRELNGMPESLVDLESIDPSGADARLSGCELIVLCDVDNPLLGERGAASVFGPQKGATPRGVLQLEAALRRLAEVVLRQTGKDMSRLVYGGTAGGAAAGLQSLLQARLVSGIDYFLQLTGFDKALERSGLVITGEGSIDEQTLQGKGPFGVASRAKAKGIPVIGVAGRVPLETDPELRRYFDVLLSIGQGPADLTGALRDTAANLVRTGTAIGNLLTLR
jgi:glycerate kinase